MYGDNILERVDGSWRHVVRLARDAALAELQAYVPACVPPARGQLNLSLLVLIFSYYPVAALHSNNLNFIPLQTYQHEQASQAFTPTTSVHTTAFESTMATAFGPNPIESDDFDPFEAPYGTFDLLDQFNDALLDPTTFLDPPLDSFSRLPSPGHATQHA